MCVCVSPLDDAKLYLVVRLFFWISREVEYRFIAIVP